jgi:gamma-glutamyl:cysteine ligase YbdK (ATP-grasp superfamily)
LTPFRPLTVGYDWELWLLEPTGEPLEEAVLLDVAARMRRARPECPTDLDFRSLELRSGVCGHIDELRERTEALLALVHAETRRRKKLFLASAGHPLHINVLGAHVHVGSIYDLEAAVRLRAALSRWMPALIALSAASPVSDGRVGGFKSYRVALRAHGCANPIVCADPSMAALDWGEDACVKVWSHPTMELRLYDAPIHPGLYLEMVALGAGLVAGVHRRLQGRSASARRSRRGWEEYLLNRIGAARHGLQATLLRDDEEVPAVRLVEEALETAEEGMTELGLPPGDLVWIPRLLEGRVTQADFLLEVYERNPDPWAYMSDLAVATAAPRAFERWLEAGPSRPLQPATTFGAEVLGGMDGFARIRDVNRWPQLPPVWLEREIRALEREGRVERIEDPDRGLCFRRVDRDEGS